jgi:hypothetical protein
MARLTTVANGVADGADPSVFARNGPSFFADPAAWLVTAAVAEALGTCTENVLAQADRTGMITVSRWCTEATMRAISRTARRGMVSPMRFAGANPGVMAGLSCITWKLRGPSLVLAADPAAALPAAAAVAASWLELGHAEYVLVAVHQVRRDGHAVRCAIVRAAGPGEPGQSLDALAEQGGMAGSL